SSPWAGWPREATTTARSKRIPIEPSTFRFIALSSLFAEGSHAKLVEIRLRVGLRPKAHRTCRAERVVFDFEMLDAIEPALDLAADLNDFHDVPFAGRDLESLFRAKLDAFAVDDLVDPAVVFQGIHAGHVVVVRILVA